MEATLARFFSDNRGSSSVGRARPCPKKEMEATLARFFSDNRGSSSVGRARPCQGRGRGFESRLPLFRSLPRFHKSIQRSLLLIFKRPKISILGRFLVCYTYHTSKGRRSRTCLPIGNVSQCQGTGNNLGRHMKRNSPPFLSYQ